MADTYKIEIKDAIPGSSFTLYLNDHPGYSPGGKANSEDFTIEIPKKYSGAGKIKVFGRSPKRTTQHFAYSIPVNLSDNKTNEVSLSRISGPAPEEGSAAKSPKALLKNRLKRSEANNPSKTLEEKELTQKIKEATKNDLREDAINNIKSATKNELKEKVESKKTGNSFWDNLK